VKPSSRFDFPTAHVLLIALAALLSAQPAGAATLAVQKVFASGSIPGDTAVVATSGFANQATSPATTVPAGGSITGTAGTAVTVSSGESGTLGEAFSAGSVNNYKQTYSCTNLGNGTVSNTGALTIGSTTTNAVCTITNTRGSTQFQLKKTWTAGATAGDTATVSSTGVAATSGTSIASAAGNSTLGSAVTALAGQTATITETLGAGNTGKYFQTLTCSGNGSGLLGNKLTFSANDAASVVCTLTNTPLVDTVAKTAYINGSTATSVQPGQTVTYAISQVSNATANPSVDLTISDTMSTNQTYVGNVAANSTSNGYACAGATLEKINGGWTLTCPADASTFSSTTLGTWSGTSNVPTNNGAAQFLYGNNSQYANAQVPNLGSLPFTVTAGDGYSPFIVYDSAGDMIISAINHHVANPAIECSNITKNSVCNSTFATSGSTQTTEHPSPVVVGTKAYFSLIGGQLGCLDYASGTPASCGTTTLISQADSTSADFYFNTAGPILANGKIYLFSSDAATQSKIFVGCYDPATGTTCLPSTGVLVATTSGTFGFYGWFDLGNGSIVLSMGSGGDYCLSVTASSTVTNCNGGAVATFTNSFMISFIPINQGGTLTGFCYGVGTTAAGPATACLNLNLTATTTYAVPMPLNDANAAMGRSLSGDAFVSGTSRVVYSVSGYLGDKLQCFDYSTNTSCGNVVPTGQKVYGTAPIPNTSCVVSFGDTASAGFKIWNAAGTLTSSTLSQCGLPLAYTFKDPATRYCAPGHGVANWGTLTLSSSTGTISSGTVVTFKDGTTGTVIGTYSVGSVAGDGAGTATVTIPSSSFPSGATYALHPTLAVTVSIAGLTAGATVTANLGNTTLGGANPEVCYNAVVNSCLASTTNSATVGTGTAYVATGSAALTCTAPVDLSITKTDGTTLLNPGGTTTYQVVVKNAASGSNAVTAAPVTDTAGAGFTITGWTCAVTSAGSGSLVTTACGAASGSGNLNTTVTMNPGAVITYTITASVTATSGSVTNTATVAPPSSTYLNSGTSCTAASAPGPGTAVAYTAATGVCTATDTDMFQPTLKIAKTLTGGAATSNTFNFSLTGVSNTSDSTANVANGATVTSAAQHVGTAGTSATITETSATSPALSGYLTGVSCIDANAPGDGNSTTPITAAATNVTIPATSMVANAAWTCTYTNTAMANVSIAKTDNTTTYSPGGSGTYVLTVTNAVSATATVTGATVSDLLPAGLTIAAPGITCTPTGAGTTCNGSGSPIGTTGTNSLNVISGLSLTLPPGGTVTISIPVTYAGSATSY
jgi:uncharacterized repeat protein (TIGR01451 family)